MKREFEHPTYERWMYGDPANVIDRMESKTCKGCIFEEKAFGAKYCGKGQRYGRRCKQYRGDDEGENAI